MNEESKNDLIEALKIAFTYMPKSIEVNTFEYGERCDVILSHINSVREILLINEIDPDEVYGEINPDISPNSTY